MMRPMIALLVVCGVILVLSGRRTWGAADHPALARRCKMANLCVYGGFLLILLALALTIGMFIHSLILKLGGI